MKYTNFNKVPVEIQEFFYNELVQEPTGEFLESEPDSEGYVYKSPIMHDVEYLRLHVRGESKSLKDLDRVIGLNKPMSVLVRFSEIISETIRWEWLCTFESYLDECERIRNHNAQIENDEDGLPLSPKLEAPQAPVRAKVLTGDEILAPYQRKLFKASREVLVENITVEVDGMVFDGDEVSQARMGRAVLVMTSTEKMGWVLNDNTEVLVTKAQLKQALKLSGTEQSKLWTTK